MEAIVCLITRRGAFNNHVQALKDKVIYISDICIYFYEITYPRTFYMVQPKLDKTK